MADLSRVTDSTRSTIGRYFGVVSALPSVLVVVWTVLLVNSGAWTGTPDLRRAFASLADLQLGEVAALGLASLAVGLVLHPLQFAFVQFLEGYWGTGQAAQKARRARMWHHHRRLLALRLEATAAEVKLVAMDERVASSHAESDADQLRRLQLASLAGEADRVTMDRPDTVDDSMPTRLGGVLRYYERNVGAPYGLDAVRVMPYLSRVAAPGDMAYVNDQRSQLDLAVRMTIVSLMCCSISVLFLAKHGLWLMSALLPYLAAYLSYRGAIVAAAEYGRSLAVVIALNRFALYDRLRVAPPIDTTNERTSNEVLMDLLSYAAHEDATVEYVGSSPPRPPDASHPAPAPVRSTRPDLPRRRYRELFRRS